MRNSFQCAISTLEKSPIPAALADLRFRIVWANPAATEAYPGLMLGDGLALMMPSDGLTEIRRAMEKNQMPQSVPLLPLQVTLSATPIDGGYLVQFSRLESVRETSLNPTGNNRLIAAITGQLRTPLSDIFAELSAIARLPNFEDDERLPELSDRINQDSYRLLRFTTSMTSYLRYLNANDNEPLRKRRIDLRELISNITSAAAVLTSTISISLTANLPNESVAIDGDPEQLIEAMTHLIGNSCRYSRAENKICVSLTVQGRAATITVSDCGAGIPATMTAQVFEPFFSYDAENRPYTGGGLGLTVVRYIVARHGGTIALSSVEGEGTTIALRLPNVVAGENVPALNNPMRVSDLLCDRYSILHILLCESCGVPHP